MIKRISIDSTLALDQKGLNDNFEDAEQRIADLEKVSGYVSGIVGNGSVCRIVQGAKIITMGIGTHPDLRLAELFAQVGDSVKQPISILIRRSGIQGKTVLAEIKFKSGENAGKMQIGDIRGDIMISKNDEIEIEPNGTRRVAIFMTFEPAEAV